MSMKIVGYIVVEHDGDFESPLDLTHENGYPREGLLEYSDNNTHLFATRALARAAINRTEHYRLAFSDTCFPVSKYCRVIAVRTGA